MMEYVSFYVFGEHDAIGFCPFSIESGSDRADAPLVQSYIKLKELMPLLTKYQGKGVMNGLLFDEENKERILSYDDLEITCRHYFTLPWDPRARMALYGLKGEVFCYVWLQMSISLPAVVGT